MNKKPSIAIVIPVYNEQEYLGACLAAISRQTVKPAQVIIVDNNSTDASLEIASAYDFVTVVKEERQGIVYARDAGFNAVAADIIGRIDADTRLEKNWVELVQNYFAENESHYAITGECTFYDASLSRGAQKIHSLGYYEIQKLLTGVMPLWGSNMAMRRSAWEQVEKDCHAIDGIDEDIDLSINLYKNGYKVRHIMSLHAGVSLRRGELDLQSLLRYLSTWPRNYIVNKMYISAFNVYILATITLLSALMANFWLNARKVLVKETS